MSPQHKIYYFALFHVVLWTLLPAVFHPNMPLDMTELVSWGHQWQWGYPKHPPLSSWIAEAAMVLTGNTVWVFFLLSQLSIAISFICVWKLGRQIMDERKAFMAAIILECIYYYNYTSPEFNPNVLMIPLWSALILALWHALHSGKLRYWCAVGVLSAMAMLAKYYSATLLFSIALMLVMVKSYRVHWRNAGPYIALAMFILCLLPHLLWIYQHQFPTFQYAVKRSAAEYSLLNHFIFPLKFLLSQSLAILPAILAFGIAYRIAGGKTLAFEKKPARDFLFFCGVMPFILTLLISLVFAIKLRSMWGTPLWNMTGVILFYLFAPFMLPERFPKLFYRAVAVFMAISVIAYIGSLTLAPRTRVNFNGEMAGKVISEVWKQTVPGAPLEIVVGDLWLAGNVGFYADQRLDVFTDMDIQKAPWLSKEVLRHKGGVLIWDATVEGSDVPNRLLLPCTKIIPQPPLSLPRHRVKGKDVVGWAIIMPSTQPRSSKKTCDS